MIPVAILDAAMLVAESAEMPLHNLGVLLLEPSAPDDADPYEAMHRMLEARLDLVPTFRHRLVQGPLGLGDLRWIEDPRFELRRHLFRATLPKPGGRAELAALVGDFASHPLDREKPLWEMVLVEGLASGEAAVVAKIHHATMDGMHLAAMLGDLFDRTPAQELPEPRADGWSPEPEPGVLRLVADSARTLAHKPLQVLGAGREIARAVLRSRAPSEPGGPRRSERPKVPATPWSGAVSQHRVVAFGEVRLDELRAIRSAFGTTINDVVLAASTATLRRWLMAHDALPAAPLIANVPIAVKGDDAAGNQVSMLRVRLPTQESDPLVRLKRIRDETRRGKEQHRSKGSNVYRRFADLVLGVTVPALLTHAVHFYSSHHGGDLHPALWNVVISNVPGPTRDLYATGAKVTRIYPFGPVQHGSALNLTVLSVREHLCLGVLACPEKVPDVDVIARGFADEVAKLFSLAST